MEKTVLTVTLPSYPQFFFAAKDCKGMLLAKTYTNATQATKAAALLGAGWSMFKSPTSRPFYVVKARETVNVPPSDPQDQSQVSIYDRLYPMGNRMVSWEFLMST